MLMLVTASLDDESLQQLSDIGEVRYEPMARTGRLLSGSELVAAVDGVDVLVTEADRIGDEEMGAFTTLRVICACRGNPVNVDVQAATKHGLLILNAPGRNAQAVAELTVALLIMLSRNIQLAGAVMRESRSSGDGSQPHTWHRYLQLRGSELWGKTVGLLGIGAVGGSVAERLGPFAVRLVAFDPFVAEKRFEQLGVERVELDELLRQSDYVSVHASVSEASRGLIGERELRLMKPTAYFVNTARSAVSDEAALLKALQERRIAGAALDVFDEEPLPVGHPLFDLDNAILLPHIGGNTQEIAVHQGRIVVPDLQRLARGDRPMHVVNPEVWARFQLGDGATIGATAPESTGDAR